MIRPRKLEKTATAVVLRNVAKHDWGWFSREDERMHLQTVEKGALKGPKKVKVWLEDRGQRTFELVEGEMSTGHLETLRERIAAERDVIEVRWIAWMIEKGWLEAELTGSIVKLTAYPASHDCFQRELDLREEFPGAYTSHPSWDDVPVYVDLDLEHAMLAVGTKKNFDDRDHVDLGPLLWHG